jgi:DNA-binding transcriptional MerR regulator
MTIDELARHAGLPARTIREYQTMRLLAPPRRQGRVGFYGEDHRRRLGLIARLQQRGYSLAGIRDLLQAWDAGGNLPGLLGVEVGPAALDETPLRLSRAELGARVPALSPAGIREAHAAGLITPDGRRHFLVRSPALLALVADGVRAGISLADMLDLVVLLRDQLDTLANRLADQIVPRVRASLAIPDSATDTEAFLRRGRIMLLQGVVSTLADRLGDALITRARAAPDSVLLLQAIERVRVGAVVDADGNIRMREESS